MFDIDELGKMGLQGWPLTVAIGIICVSFVAWWHGEWPWKGIVDKSTHNYYNGEEEDDDQGD